MEFTTSSKTKLLTVISLTVLVASCANRPESIAASYTSHERYMDSDCAQLASTMANARAELAEHSDKQDTAANTDAGGVFLILIPPSAFAGDSEADVAEWKGKVQAIETAQIKKKCVSN
tara:strand:- start:263 stop:619 length:357 start_codon:yes stop_codon:yes gene_type:complete